MYLIFYFLSVFSFLDNSPLYKSLFEDLDILKAISLSPSKNEQVFSYFIKKRFLGNYPEALESLLKNECSLCKILLCKLNYLGLVKYENYEKDLFQAAKNISNSYFHNKFDFHDPRLLSDLKKDSEISEILMLLKSNDEAVINSFYKNINQRTIDLKDCLKYLLQIKNNGSAFSLLGDIYYYGIGVEKDSEKAMDFYWAGRVYDSSDSFIGIGNILQEEPYNDFSTSIESYKKAIDLSGSGEAYYRLYKINKKSQENFDALNENLLNLENSCKKMYIPGIVEYFELGNSKEQEKHFLIKIIDFDLFLIKMFLKAENAFLNEDYNKSFMIYLFLSEFKNVVFLKNLIFLIKKKKVTIFKKHLLDEILFESLNEIHELKNDPKNTLELANCYYYGIGTEINYEKAFSLYLKNFILNSESLYNLIFMYENGIGVKKNLNEAFRLTLHFNTYEEYLIKKYLQIKILLKINLKKINYLLPVILIIISLLISVKKKIKKDLIINTNNTTNY